MEHFFNYRFRVNLAQIPGARILNVQLPNSQGSKPCIVIPCDANDMLYVKDGQTQVSTNINLEGMPMSKEIRESRMLQNSGKENYTAPSHFMKMFYPRKDFRELINKVAESRIKKENPDISEEDLKKQVKYKTNPIIGEMTIVAEVASGAKIENQTSTSNEFSPYPAAEQDSDASGEMPIDDLPF